MNFRHGAYSDNMHGDTHLHWWTWIIKQEIKKTLARVHNYTKWNCQTDLRSLGEPSYRICPSRKTHLVSLLCWLRHNLCGKQSIIKLKINEFFQNNIMNDIRSWFIFPHSRTFLLSMKYWACSTQLFVLVQITNYRTG